MGDRAGDRRLETRGAFLELALDASRAGTWFWDVTTNVSEWDARYHEHYGFDPDELPSFEGWLARIHPGDRERIRTRVQSLLDPGADDTWNEEFRVLHPTKGLRWMAGLGAVERDTAGRARRFRGINLDVTERKRGEELLQENLKRSEELAHVGHWVWNTAARRLSWSDEVYRIFRVTPETFDPGIESLARAVHPDDRMRAASYGALLLEGRVPEDLLECRVVVADGSTRHLLGTITSCLRDPEGTIMQLSGIMHDVTARKCAEAEILRIGEEERQRIAADLHDGVLQELAGIAYLTASVRGELEAESQALGPRMRRIEAAIIQAIDHTRQVACAVDPMLPGGNGLMGALRQFAGSVEETFAVRCSVEPHGHPVVVEDPVAANQLYRIAQESVRNAVRHGKATHIAVRLSESEDEVCLSVMDDGRGLPTNVQTGSGMGLHVMRYRAGLIGGRLTILPRHEGGTEVWCRFPRASGRRGGSSTAAPAT